MSSRYGFMFVMVVLVGLMGCESDADRIRAINEAETSGTPLSAEIQAVEIEEGDCINSTLPEGVTIESVVIVPCTGAWQYRALGSFEVADADHYPGEESFERQAFERCDKRFTDFLFPLDESWELGDRGVACLQASFGLSTTDPAKLDRLIGMEGLHIGACFNEALETGGLLVGLVDCSEAWEFRVLNSFEVEADGRYPDDSFFNQKAYQTCDERFTTTASPSVDTWAMGDREVICLQESFGLSATDPAKLDRLIGIEGLVAGACFNETPETGGLLVERVDCSGAWESRVEHRFSVSLDTEYPGEFYFQNLAAGDCGATWDYYYAPNQESWSLGDRTMICVTER